jgi:predicted dehydrogenase
MHVLCEKPLARTSEEAEAMVAAATEADRVLQVVFNHRVRGDVQVLKRYIDEGKLGKIYYAKASWMRRRGIPGAGTWFVSKEKAGGGPLIDLGVHMLDMALYLLGEPEVLTVSASTYDELARSGKGIDQNARKSGADNIYEVEDLATAFMRLAGGATLLLEASWATNSSAGDDFGITLYGSEGGAEIKVRSYNWQDTLDIYTDIAGTSATIHPQLYRGDGHISVVREFVDIIKSGKWLQHNGIEGLNRVRIIDACYTSASEGHEVSLYGTSHMDDEDEPEGDE